MATRAPRNPFALTPSKPVLRALEGATRRRVLPAKAGIQRGAGQGTPNPHRALDSPTLRRRGASRSARPAAAGLSPLHHQQPPPHPILPASPHIPPPLARRGTLTRPYCPHSTPPLPSPHGTRMQHPRTAHRHHLRAMALPARTVRIDARVRFRPRQPEVVSHGRKSWDQYLYLERRRQLRPPRRNNLPQPLGLHSVGGGNPSARRAGAPHESASRAPTLCLRHTRGRAKLCPAKTTEVTSCMKD